MQTYLDNVYVGPENVLLKEGGFKKQIAGFNVERIGNTARSLAFGRYAYEAGAPVGDAAQAVRAPAVRVPGPAVEIRRHENQARRRPAAALPRGRQRRSRHSVRRGNGDRQGVLQPGRLRHLQRGDAGHGRHGLYRGNAGRILLPQVPRLDDRRRLDRDSEEPHRRKRLRAHVFAAPAESRKKISIFKYLCNFPVPICLRTSASQTCPISRLPRLYSRRVPSR